MSIATEITRLQNAKASIKTSIENKGVTVPSATKLDGYSALIDTIQTGSQVTVESLSVTQNGTYQESGKAYSPVIVNVPTEVEEAEIKDVNFFDYDGTCVYSYTYSEWANQTELPPNPSHEGLIAQGWNWTKAEIDSQITNVPECPVQVGQHYVTKSGKTEIDIFLTEQNRSPYLSLGVKGTILIDWGDGNEATSVTGTNINALKNTNHTYANGGYYTIKVELVSGSYSIGTGNNSARKLLINANGSDDNHNYVYNNAIRDIRIGVLGAEGVIGCQPCIPNFITKLNIPYNVKIAITNSIGNGLYLDCVVVPKTFTNQEDVVSRLPNVKTICFPPTAQIITIASCYALKNVTFVSGSTFKQGVLSSQNPVANCRSLMKAVIPSSNTAIPNQCFRYCYSLASAIIPDTVTSIGTLVFGACYHLKEVHLKPTTPPTLSNVNSFDGVPSSCVFYVPYSADHSVLDAYKTASNWSTFADQMVEESQ